MTARHLVRLVGMLGLIVLAYFLVPVDRHPAGGPVLRAALTLLVLLALATLVLAQVRLTLDRPERHVDGLIGAIVLVWVVFALAFYVLHLHQPDQMVGLHTRLDALYFAATTMLTVGYGDVQATGQLARVLVLMQMAFDIVFVATAAAVLSARLREAATRPREDSAGRAPLRLRRARRDRSQPDL